MFRKLRTVIYYAPDLDKAREWYTRATGKEPYFNESFYVGFDIDGYELGLDPNVAEPVEGNQVVAYWAVDDATEALSKLEGLGGTVLQPRTNVGGTIHVAIVRDPFGNHVGLIEGA